MIARRHPVIAAQMIRSMELGPTIPSLLSLGDVARTILDMGGVEVPSWPALVDGVRPPPRDPEAAFRVEQQFREQQLLLVLSESERALLCSQSGPGAGSFLTVPPTNPLVRFDSQIFRVLLLRRLRLPLPCPGVSADVAVSLTNLAIIVRAGVLGRRGFALESVVARVCREGGVRVTTNMFVRDLDLDVPNAARDGRRLEVVADGLPLFGGVQLAIDTTLVSLLHSNGSACRRP